MASSREIFDFTLTPQQNLLNLLSFAEGQGVIEPTAMNLATVDAEGNPRNRMVLFKGLLQGGLSFYTNYQSPKSSDLIFSKKAAVCFFWPNLATQIRFEGGVTKATRAESEAYFKTRPRVSQIGAWASDQSTPIHAYSDFEKKVSEFTEKFAGVEVPCPPHWGGFILDISQAEFWFGVDGRLHYRHQYRKLSGENKWATTMLSP